MKPAPKKTLVAIAKAGIIFGVTSVNPAMAGIPVIDSSTLAQTAIAAKEEVAQTLKQLDEYATQLNQYQTQIKQYQNMVQNTLQPAQNIWQSANSTVNKLVGMTNTIGSLQSKYGSLQGYINKFQSTSSYQQNACFNGSGCSQAQLSDVLSSQSAASQAQLDADAASLQGLEQQQTNLQTDAANLEQLQSAAQSAEGQMQALGYANQLASSQANQLLQIRSLLIAQQNVLTTRMQAQADKEARQDAAAVKLRNANYQASPTSNAWNFDAK